MAPGNRESGDRYGPGACRQSLYIVYNPNPSSIEAQAELYPDKIDNGGRPQSQFTRRYFVPPNSRLASILTPISLVSTSVRVQDADVSPSAISPGRQHRRPDVGGRRADGPPIIAESMNLLSPDLSSNGTPWRSGDAVEGIVYVGGTPIQP